jgi:hypothetical protein
MDTRPVTRNQHFLVRNTNMRNELLKKTDYYMLVDVYEKLTEDERKQVKDYRQSLRDHINNNREKYLIEGLPFVEFPPSPSFIKQEILKY